MILTCPNCGTQYVVKDGAIPPDGRQVRCASCKHSWHQDPEVVDAAPAQAVPEAQEPAASAEPETAPAEESVAEAALIEPRSGPELEERAFEEASLPPATDPPANASAEGSRAQAAPLPAPEPDYAPPQSADPQQTWQDQGSADDFSPFAAADDADAPRRRSPLLVLLLVALLVAALAAAFWFLAPDQWKMRAGLGGAGASPLAFVITHRERQQLQSGNQLLTISGRIINPTATEQSVPPIQAQLKTRQGRVIYSWTIAPPTRSLPPGASASFNSAEVNVPPGGDDVTITTAANG